MIRLALTSLLGSAMLLSACAVSQAPRAKEDIYTAESTYAKLAPRYPFIRVASREVPATVRTVRNVAYVRYGARSLYLDLYLPASAQRKPVSGIVFVHGGAWRVGTRENFAPMAIRMAERGYAAATISYRLAGEAPYPAAVQDVKAAVRWMRAHAADYRIDPTHIAVAGGSAGGQIASLAGVTDATPRFDPQAAHSEVSSAVQAIVNIDGLSDFRAEVERLRKDAASRQRMSEDAWFGGWFQGSEAEKSAAWREASPLSYVGPATPPILFIGSAQPRFSIGRDAMVARLQADGVDTQVVVLPDTPHSFWLFDPWLQPTVDATVAFLNRHFNELETRH
jgi:pectinesterase